MSIYMYRSNDNKLHFLYCYNCGGFDLGNPQGFEPDRAVVTFTCNVCGYHPYFLAIGTNDIIELTKDNMDEYLVMICKEQNLDPDEYKFRGDIRRMIGK